MMNKHELRTKLKDLRAKLPEKTRIEWSAEICSRLQDILSQESPNCLMGYLALPGEVIVDPLLYQLHSARVRVGLPVVKNGTVEPYTLVPRNQLRSGPFKLLEPDLRFASPIPLEEIELIILPGLGFDGQGHRLGFGKGYYDRFLSQFVQLPRLIAVAFEFQILREIPHEPHDMPVDLIVTPERVISSSITN